jgi:hypothetical protein
MPEKDYSRFITNPSRKEDDRPFWLRLLLSIRPAISFSAKKINSVDDVKNKVSFKISGGADF